MSWNKAPPTSSPECASASTGSGCVFDLAEKRRQIQELEAQTSDPEFWGDTNRARRVMRQMASLKNPVDTWEQMDAQVADLIELEELAGEDASLSEEVSTQADELAGELDKLELQLLLNTPYDDHDAILAIHAGTGGVDAQDWAEMLSRMYLRWAEKRGFGVTILDWTTGDEAGIKSATIELRGPYAYGYIKAEAGTHRLVRLSPFDAAHRRHTAFALVEALPAVEEDDTVEIRDDDLRIDTFRASGAGGQHVNKTSSAVRITHLPTGIVTSCQDERSQLQNRESAMKILRARLVELKIREREAEQARIKGEPVVEGWGNRIRSYVLQPYTMVNDHRTDFSTGNVSGVLDGDLDPLIDAYLHQQLEESQQVANAD
ncbi:MAG: peptide chain release factor 2 [Chloroflexia bacterium]|nr:peptide chain release factor 2 [Chloroflexia bacterium]